MNGRGREKSSTAASGAQSWRELAGPRRKRINSPQAKKRRREQWLKVFLAVVCACAIGGAITAFVLTREDTVEKTIDITPPSRPVERIIFNTNGMLPNGWLSSVLKLRPGTEMMEVDIHALKGRLEADGQVKSAKVERVFPSSLQIVVEERVPVMRLVATMPDGSKRQRIVARDGTVYDGLGYPRSVLSNLPFIIPYQHEGKVFPLAGIERVADLLELALQEAPQLFATWQVVDLTHYSGDLDLPGQVIEVRSKLVPRIIFSATADFGQQLDRLAYILSYVQNRGNPSVERIDLSLRGSAAVQFSSGRIGTF